MNPQNQQPPANYLDEIATQPQKSQSFGLNLRTVMIAGGLLLVLMIVIVNIAGSMGNARVEPWQRLSARLAATSTIADTSTPSIKNGQLKSINSELKIYLANTQRDMSAPLASLKVQTEKLPAKITTQENGEQILQRLEDARLNAKFDSTYAREMTYQLSTILTLLQELYGGNSSPATKAILENAYNSLAPLQKNVANYSASTE